MKSRPGIWLFAGFFTGAAMVWLAGGFGSGGAIPPRPGEPGASPPQASSAASAAGADIARTDVVGANRAGADLARTVVGEDAVIDFRARIEAGSGDLSLLLRQWARTDPTNFVEALPTLDLGNATRAADSDQPPWLAALRIASESDPAYALAVGERHAGTVGTWIRATALEALAADDPDVALEYLDGIEPGDVRDRLLASVAAGFARTNPDAAVAWLASLGEIDGAAFYPVIGAIANIDLPWAIELDARAIELDYGSPDYGDVSWLRKGLETGRQNPGRIADLFASMQSTGLLAETLAWWALGDPYGAIAWIQSQQTISSVVVSRMAEELASRDYQSAMTLTAQFNPAVGAVWVESVLGSAAPYDLSGVLDELERYRGEGFFDDTLSRVLRIANDTLGAPAAAAIAGNSPPARMASEIVNDWSDIDPVAAAKWVLEIGDDTVRAATLRRLILGWPVADLDLAESWVSSIADDALRASLEAYLCGRIQTCEPKFQ